MDCAAETEEYLVYGLLAHYSVMALVVVFIGNMNFDTQAWQIILKIVTMAMIRWTNMGAIYPVFCK